MQDPRSNSTLELVVNEQQLQNMSQIDLSRPGESANQGERAQVNASQGGDPFSLQRLKEWPARFRESFSAKMDEAKAKSDTKTQLVIEVMHTFSGIFIWILCFIFTIILPVFLFFVGLINLDDCADRPALPYLIFATGFAMTASNLFNLALSMDLPILTNHQILTNDIKNIIASIINILFNCIVAFLYVLCAYMIYSMSSSKQNAGSKSSTSDLGEPSEESMDCDGLLYYSSFWFITLTLSLVVLFTLLACIFFAYNKYRLAIIRGSTPRSHANTNANLPSV